MVTMVVYLKFEKAYNGRKLYHSGPHRFLEPSRTCCELSLEIEKEEFSQAGWILVEERLIKISYT